MAVLTFLPSTVFSQGTESSQVAEGEITPGLPRPMTLAIAKQIVTAAHKAACTPPSNCMGAFAIVDDAGVLIYEESIDGVLPHVPELTILKARTAAVWRRPTSYFQDSVKSGRNYAYIDGSFQDMTLATCGIPLFVKGRVVGGFGCGGSGPQYDPQIMEAARAETARIMGK